MKKKVKVQRVLSIIHCDVSEIIFIIIMTCETINNDRRRRMQVLNLKRDFETLSIKEKKTIQEYYNPLTVRLSKQVKNNLFYYPQFYNCK